MKYISLVNVYLISLQNQQFWKMIQSKGEIIIKYLLYSLGRRETSLGAHFLRTITGIESGPHALWWFRLEMKADNIDMYFLI